MSSPFISGCDKMTFLYALRNSNNLTIIAVMKVILVDRLTFSCIWGGKIFWTRKYNIRVTFNSHSFDGELFWRSCMGLGWLGSKAKIKLDNYFIDTLVILTII